MTLGVIPDAMLIIIIVAIETIIAVTMIETVIVGITVIIMLVDPAMTMMIDVAVVLPNLTLLTIVIKNMRISWRRKLTLPVA